MDKYESTIAALSTAAGEGGISVIRISGTEAKQKAQKIVKLKTKNIVPRYMYLGKLDTGSVSDEVMLVWFKAPYSYTGGEVVEIQCHGSPVIAEEILKALVNDGVKMAKAGEFTKRAFLNGKIDLTKAEGIIDIINAQTTGEVNSSFEMMQGNLFKRIKKIQDHIIKLTAETEAAIDYPEEDIEELTENTIKSGLDQIKTEIESLIKSYESGKILRSGVNVAIIGEPNAGKSMLYNRLIDEDRAIVTDKKGTTRDVIKESFKHNGVRFVLSDTAGIRETDDEIEKIGIEKTLQAAKSADVIIALYETGTIFDSELPKNKPVIYAENKIDLKTAANQAGDIVKGVKKENSKTRENAVIYISAKDNINIDALKNKLFEVSVGKVSIKETGLVNVRQLEAAKRALKNINSAQNNLGQLTLDCITADLHHAYTDLGEITGVTASDRIVEEIFARFCVGK